jgi:citrate lyase subunit beta/citryl-CoA lyase
MSTSPETPVQRRLARSLLFVPGNRPERFQKAMASGAHEVVLDLEDAVAPRDKEDARRAVASWLATGKRAGVRINGADTEWHGADLAMIMSHPGIVIMLPKAEMGAVKDTVRALEGQPDRQPIIALLETARGLQDVGALADAPGVGRLAFGSIDFSAETGIADEGEGLTAVRTRIVLASCIAGLPAPVDGVSVEFNDGERMQQEALRARRLGFGGKLCIHPRQIGPVHAAFQPSASEVDWARRVLAAAQASQGAATAVDGKMIDKPVVERALAIVAEAGVS